MPGQELNLRDALAIAIVKSTREARLLAKQWETKANDLVVQSKEWEDKAKNWEAKAKNWEKEACTFQSQCEMQKVDLKLVQGKLSEITQQLNLACQIKDNFEKLQLEHHVLAGRQTKMIQDKFDQTHLPQNGYCEESDTLMSEILENEDNKEETLQAQIEEEIVQSMGLLDHRLQNKKIHLVNNVHALLCSAKFLVFACGCSSEDPVYRQYSKLSLEICCLKHSLTQNTIASEVEPVLRELLCGLLSRLVKQSNTNLKDPEGSNKLGPNIEGLLGCIFESDRAGPIMFMATTNELHKALLANLGRTQVKEEDKDQRSMKAELLVLILQSSVNYIREWDFSIEGIEEGCDMLMQTFKLSAKSRKACPNLSQQLSRVVIQFMGHVEQIASMASCESSATSRMQTRGAKI